MRDFSAISCLILFFLIFSSASPDTLTHTLDSYIIYALKHNLSIQAARSAAAAAKQDIRLAAALPDPMLMARAEIDDGLRPASIGLSQMLMQPAKLVLEKKSARHKRETGQALVRQAMADVVFSVRRVYFMLYETGQLIAIKRRNLELLKQYEEITRTAY